MKPQRRSGAKTASGEPLKSKRLNVLGYDIELILPTVKARRRAALLLGIHGIAPAKSEPVLAVELVEDLNLYEAGGPLFDPGILLGDGFSLDYARKRLLYPAAALARAHMKNLGSQNPLTRTIIFSIALLAEHNGLDSVRSKSMPSHAPLYLHASSVLTPKGALVFCGECTFGKTTISTQLLKKFPLLEDDQVTILVALDRNKKRSSSRAHPRVVVFGDSRKRKTRLDAISAPLAGIFWLNKSPENRFEPLDQVEAAALMLDPMVGWRNPVALKQRLKLFRALFEAVPCKRLAFKKDSAALLEFLEREGYV